MANLEIGVGWDNSQLERGISDAEKQLQTLERRREARVRIGADVGDLDRRIADVNTRLGSLRTNLNSAGTAAQNFNRQTANGSNTLTQFSRIAQDAPFGIMGIGNNLTATAEAFANLSRQSGGARAALSAVGQSLLGSGGLLLAISLVTTGLTIMAQKGLTVGDVFDKLTGNFDSARRAAQEFNVEVVKDSQGQISTMNAYVAVAKNVNLSMSDRLLAVKKLQDEYPGYFGNLTKEQILNGNVASTVREVTKALIAKAKAAGLTDRIVKLAEEEEKIQNQINNTIAATARSYRLSNKQAFEFAKILNQQLRGEIDLFKELEDAQGKGGTAGWEAMRKYALTALRTIPIYDDLTQRLTSNKAEQDRLTGSLEKQTAAQIKLNTEKAKAVKPPNVTPQVTGVDNLINPAGLVDLTQFEQLNGKIDEFGNKIRELPGTIQSSLSKIPAYFDTSLQKALERLQNFNKQLSQIVTSGTVNAVAGIGEAIGSALANGGNIIDSVGKSLLSTIGSLLVDLGKATIAYGVGLLAIQTAIKNPYTAIAAGAALVVVGSAISAAVSKTAKGMPGGNASTGSGYSSPGSSVSYGGSGSSSGFGSGTVVFEISGTSLIGVLSNSLDRNSRLGGALGI